MGVTSLAEEFPCPVAPGRIFKALIVGAKNLIPKPLPQFIASVDVIQGDGGAGTIEQINFTDASPFKYAKHRIDELDHENFVCKYSLIEGDLLGDKLASVDHQLKFEAAVDEGCMCKFSSKYNTKGEFSVDEEEIKEGKEKAMAIVKAVESYLLENPYVYA